MPRYDDYRSSTGTLDSHDRYDRYSRGPPVAERPRVVEDRFETRLREDQQYQQYGPPARAPGRLYEDDHLEVAHDRPRRDVRPRPDDSPSFRRPQLIRRQSSLDTFDRTPRHQMEMRTLRSPRVSAPPRHLPSPGRFREREVYEDIRIAEPDYYGDEEFREIRDRDMADHRRRSSSSVRRHVEKPYPRKGKTRIPRHLANRDAILQLGYPLKEEVDVTLVLKALSKEQIDEVIALSREYNRESHRRSRGRDRRSYDRRSYDSRSEDEEFEYIRMSASPPPHAHMRERSRERVEYLQVEAPTPPSNGARILEVSPSRHRSVSQVREIAPRRAVSAHDHRRLHFEERESVPANSLVLVRPRDDDDYQLETDMRRLRVNRGGIEITRRHDTDFIDDRGNGEEITDVRREQRREPNSRIMRAMMATLT